jgi:hypothetical protein
MGERNKKEKMDWECEYCHKEFKTAQECGEHELNCPIKPVRVRGYIKTKFGVWEGFKFGIGLFLAMLFIGTIIFFILTALGAGILNYILG